MFTPIYRLFVVVVVLFGALVFATSWWTVFGADPLRDNPANRRALLEQARIKRGFIKAADGTVLARSVKRSDGTFTRRYPQGELLSHAVGYSFIRFGQAGLERSRNSALTGARDDITSIVDELQGKRQEGDNVFTTLDTRAQRVAIDALGGQKGAVVAMDPSSGAVKVMASVPQYDPNRIPDIFSRLNQDPDAPLLNRTTQGQYPPGSTFKVVTAVAGIDSGKFSPDSVLNGDSPKTISGASLSNDGGRVVRRHQPDAGPHQLGQHGVGAGGPDRGPADDGQVHGALRLLRAPAPGLPGGPALRQRSVHVEGPDAGDEQSGRHRARGDRPGRPARHASPDGHGRGRRGQRRHPGEAPPHRPHRRPRRACER